MPHPMRQKKREVTDRAIVCAMLDQMDVICLGIHEEPAPYVVPLNFGYEFEDDLVLYFHCAREGHKLDLLRRNPNVCATAAQFISYADAPVKGHLHDYRSVIARGRAERIDPASPQFRHAMERILSHNHRDPAQADTPALGYLEIWRVVCPAAEVTAKAEIMPAAPQDVPFAPPIGDGRPLDESHILEMKK